MRLRFASTALDRMTMALTARQNGLTAGPVLHAKWDLSAEVIPAPSGRIAIAVDRSTVQVAPDSVRFSVRIGEGAFAVPGPAPGAFYDPRLHDLIYLWDFGTSEDGEWTAPENVLPSWKNRRYAKGPWVSHVFREPGEKTVSVLVIDPATGDRHTDIVTFEVHDADLFYSAANPLGFTGCETTCINPLGDSDFTGAPAGANLVNADDVLNDSAVWTAQRRSSVNGKGSQRFLFKRGGTYTFGVKLTSGGAGLGDRPHMFFGDYGDPTLPKPVWEAPTSEPAGAGKGNTCLEAGGEWNIDQGTLSPDLRIVNIVGVGRCDPSLRRGSAEPATVGQRWIYLDRACDLVMLNCEARGFRSAIFYGDASDAYGAVEATPMHHAFDNCFFTDMGGQYPLYWPSNPRSNTSISMLGCRVMQNVDAFTSRGDESPDMRSLYRHNGCKYTHHRGCDWFSTTMGNTAVKLAENAGDYRVVINVHSCSIEGDLVQLGLGTNVGAKNSIGTLDHNCIVDGMILVGSYMTQRSILCCLTGVTIRNCLTIVPPQENFPGKGYGRAITLRLEKTPPPLIRQQPVRVYNNTFVFQRDPGGQPVLVELLANNAGDVFDNYTTDNNVLEGLWQGQSGAGEGSPFAPLSDTVLWAPRNRGYRDPDTFERSPQYATPPDAVKAYAPLAGEALGEALEGLVSHMDIDLRFRPAYPSKGAWEMPEE